MHRHPRRQHYSLRPSVAGAGAERRRPRSLLYSVLFSHPPPVLCLCISRLILEVVWVCGISGAAGGEVHITHPLYIRLLHGSVALSEAPPPGPPPARGGVASLVNGGLDERIAGERGTEDTVVSTLVR